MNAIHVKGYAHRDLKLKNILIKDRKIIKIADFGISKDKTAMSTYVGTENFMVIDFFLYFLKILILILFPFIIILQAPELID